MSTLVQSFDQLTADQQSSAGGKGGTLARLKQAGYPVPDGFVILPAAFSDDRLSLGAWTQVQTHLDRLRNGDQSTAFAVRSSALSEDSAQASFAGEFETLLDVHSDEMVQAAIHTVRGSRASERVQAYSQAHGLEEAHDMAVVVQRLVRAEVSGVMFTADPVSGSFAQMIGNYVYGLGEELVSGEAEPYTFTLSRPKGRYDGPRDLKRYARRLYKLGLRLEKELGGPQDIEWAVSGGDLYLLQSRPVTTLQGYNPVTGEWNSSLMGDFFWTNVNAAEARPDVMSPLTWTLGNTLRAENQPMPGDYPWVGNIAGRNYVNVTMTLSMFRSLGISPKRMVKRMADLFGPIPEGMEPPLFPLPLSTFFSSFPGMRKILRKEKEMAKQLPDWLPANPEWCRQAEQRLQGMETIDELQSFWFDELKPYFFDQAMMMGGAVRPYFKLVRKLRPRLVKLVGEADANALLSNLSTDDDLLASLGPVVGVAKVAQGEMSRQEYLEMYGHRGPHEMELSAPRPAEEPDWLERRLADYAQFPVDMDGLWDRRRAEYDAAWGRFAERYPRKAKAMRRLLEEVGPAARLREAFRSETVRVYGVIRAFALRAGQLTGLGKDVFFLTYEELLQILAARADAGTFTRSLAARKETYERLRALPTPPSIIRGRFDPYQWAADPDRRNDIYDASLPVPVSDSTTLTGFAGAAGRVEGLVRRLDQFEEGDQLQPGEILVTAMTNVGWTPIFPRAAAVVTDVGAPLSHAAIVARELGIPAVVGCV
ncbi:MAG TPA: PEP/pyruvate-binding domain-containing protein, partial [Anaerolineae bacterium]|nr:PEP/pyruvate-binding domain-containing protein [Anaerolineae bacterium]